MAEELIFSPRFKAADIPRTKSTKINIPTTIITAWIGASKAIPTRPKDLIILITSNILQGPI
jgi:hypothetical protein